METIEIRSVLVATDLGESADRLLRTASSIAALTGAELHVTHVHLLPDTPHPAGTPEAETVAQGVAEAEAELDDAVRRGVPAGYEPTSRVVLAAASPSEAIRRHAEELSCDLIVIGPHRGRLAERPFLGTTADRLVSTAGVPCLVVRDGPEFPIRRLGVLVDFSPAAQAALDTATAWMMAFSGGTAPAQGEAQRPRISVGHIFWEARSADRRGQSADRIQAGLEGSIERTRGRLPAAETIEYHPEVLRAGDAVEVVTNWVRANELPLIVLGTRGTSRLPYVYLGGLASAVTRTAPCSVLLVPPEYAPESLREEREERVRLRRIVTGVDFHDASWEAALWAMRHFAPVAEHDLIHVVDLPDLPGPLRSLGGQREQVRVAARQAGQRRLEELRDLASCPSVGVHVSGGKPGQEILRLAEEVDADLIIVGEQGPRHGIAALLGSTAERVLLHSSTPVLLARKVADSPPRSLLVAIDTTDAADRVLDWAASLLERFDASATVMNVVDRLLLADELTGLPSGDGLRQLEKQAKEAMREWLEEKVRSSGLPEGRVQTMVTVGDPSYEIIAEAQKLSAELVLIGSRRGDVARTPLVGRIVNKVVRSAPCSVLVVTTRGYPAAEEVPA
ncbi:MAG TPA: universal stress protein [Longimicrobiaceae bacterium]